MNLRLICRNAAAGSLLFLPATLALAAPPKPPEPPPLELPKPPPAQVSSSEGMPPLPYPVVPMKRQEKKNPPEPPVLITKIRTADAEDWTRTPNDIKKLLEWMSAQMNVNFTSNIKSFSEIDKQPDGNPILFRSGYKSFRLAPEEIAALREYLLNGGTVVFNALVGNPDFYASALQAAKEIIPERPVYRLRADHPLFRSFYDIDKVKWRERMRRDGVAVDDHPYLEGVDIDNRSAIIISRWDVSLGWEENKHESWGYSDEDAKRLGANMVSYVTAMRDAGRSVGKSVELIDADKKQAGKFRVGYVIHEGPWKTRTAAFPMLLNQFGKVTGTPVSFELRDVSLKDQAIFEYPFLYFTGTIDFVLSDEERSNLRQFLARGGVLFVEAGEGRASFDGAFRQEIAQVLPGQKLTAIPADHPLFLQPQAIPHVKARPALAVRHGGKTEIVPELYGIEIGGVLGVIYCPYDLSAGWERAVAPYALGYESADATALGLNTLYYAVTH